MKKNEALLDMEISAALQQAARAARLVPELDVDRQQAATHCEQKIDFRSGVRSPEIWLDGFTRGAQSSDDLLDHPPLPRRSQLGMRTQAVPVADAQQGMQHARIAHIHLWDFDETLADVGPVRRQPPNHERTFEKIQVTADGGRRNPQAGSDLAGIEQPTVKMRQHRPETAQGGS